MTGEQDRRQLLLIIMAQCDIRIKSPTYPLERELIIAHSIDDTILALKSKIKKQLLNETLLESAQKLIYAGHVLEDVKTLSELNVVLSNRVQVAPLTSVDSAQRNLSLGHRSGHQACRS